MIIVDKLVLKEIQSRDMKQSSVLGNAQFSSLFVLPAITGM